MTSIEWLIKELYTEINLSGDGRVLDEILEEAKEMHRLEIEEAQSYAISNADNDNGYFDCDKYYQETFVSKGSNDTFKVWECCGMEECICKGVDFPKDINGIVVKVGDKVQGIGSLKFQDGFEIDRTPIVTANIQNGKLYFGNLSAESFSLGFKIVESKMVEDDVEKLAEEEYPIYDGDLLGIANNQKHSRIDFIKGYNKAKSTLYTEEQMVGFAKWLAANWFPMWVKDKFVWEHDWDKTSEEQKYKGYYNEKELFNLFLSLKQPKKD